MEYICIVILLDNVNVIKDMRTTINKSDLMKRAWSIFKSEHPFYSLSFSIALTRAWEVEKSIIASNIQKQKYAELFSSNDNCSNDSVSAEKIAQEEARALTEYYNRGSYAYYAD